MSQFSEGYGTYDVSKDERISSSIGEYVTVFQSEAHAIELAARQRLQENLSDKNIYIFRPVTNSEGTYEHQNYL